MRDSSCPDCGTSLATNVLQGLCPTCVLTRVVSDSPAAEPRHTGGSVASASWEPRFEAGDKLGLYTIQHLLGRGGLGEVYAAESADGRLVALKVLRRQLRRFSDRAQFLVE